jgi:hypothetical protein
MPASPLATPTRSQRALVLLGMLALLFSLLLRVDGEGRVVLPLLELHLPGACWLQRFLPAGCPGCGLTRSFISVSHGRMVQAFRFHAPGRCCIWGCSCSSDASWCNCCVSARDAHR